MADYSGILAVGEVADAKLAAVSLELLGAGRQLADARGEPLSIVLIDREAEACAPDAIAHGADRVYVVTDAPTERYEGTSYADIVEKLSTDTVKPAILLLGQTASGRDLAPRIAFRLKTGLVTDCLRLQIKRVELHLDRTASQVTDAVPGLRDRPAATDCIGDGPDPIKRCHNAIGGTLEEIVPESSGVVRELVGDDLDGETVVASMEWRE